MKQTFIKPNTHNIVKHNINNEFQISYDIMLIKYVNTYKRIKFFKIFKMRSKLCFL